MKNIMFTIGLPRSGSTVLMNILQQNPEFFTTGTCPIPYLIDAIHNRSSEVSEFIAMDQQVLSDALTNFIKQGTDGWFDSMTHKPTVISKSRSWDTCLPLLFKMYENPKFIVCVRDLRDIVCSFEKLLLKYPHIKTNDSNQAQTLDERIRSYCLDDFSNLGRPLRNLPFVFEMFMKYPNNFFLFRFEDFNANPNNSLDSLYHWMGKERFNHDLKNIKQSEYIEHDTTYRALVEHKTRPVLEQLPNDGWKSMLTEQQSASVLSNNSWFYQTFYPEL